jgi:hypothetical protein
VLTKWTGWGNLNKKHTVTIQTNSKLKQVEIDPTQRLGDYNPNNNTWKKHPNWYLDKGNYPTSDVRKVSIGIRPDVWYNTVDGVKAGINIERQYGQLNRTNIAAWYSTGAGGFGGDTEPMQLFQYQLDYDRKLAHNFDWDLQVRNKEGLEFYSTQLNKQFGNNTVSGRIKAMNRPGRYSSLYSPFARNWNTNQWNNSIQLNYERVMRGFNNYSVLNIHTKNSALFSNYNFAEIGLNLVNYITIVTMPLRTRLYGVYQTGNNIPLESQIYLQGANPEEMMDNKFTSAAVLWNQTGFGNDIGQYQWMGGGLNIRGMANYAAPVREDSIFVSPLFSGRRGVSVSGELEFDHFIKLKPKWFRDWLHIDAYIFGDAGLIAGNGQSGKIIGSDVTADAGLGTAFTVNSWGRKLSKAKPFVLRIDFPFFVNRLPAVSTGDYFDFRMVFGINRSF